MTIHQAHVHTGELGYVPEWRLDNDALSLCLPVLLKALGWKGDDRHLSEVLPHMEKHVDLTEFRNICAKVGFPSRTRRSSLNDLRAGDIPCLFIRNSGKPVVILSSQSSSFLAFDPEADEIVTLENGEETGKSVYFESPELSDLVNAKHNSKQSWFFTVVYRFAPQLLSCFWISAVISILALATPIFIMSVYDRVIGAETQTTLQYLLFGVAIALVSDFLLKLIRTALLARFGARIDQLVGFALFERLLMLPPGFTENASVSVQVARFKDFETIRDFFTGSLAMSLMELPFTILFVGVIAWLSGWIVLVPITVSICMILMLVLMRTAVKNRVGKSARFSGERQELAMECLNHIRLLKASGSEKLWLEKYRDSTASAALSSLKSTEISMLISTLSNSMTMVAGLLTIVFGIQAVINGAMSVGALIATMMLVWRVLAPVQNAFVLLSRMAQVKASVAQVDKLMNLKPEREAIHRVKPINKIEGAIEFEKVTFRYSSNNEPALTGVNFSIQPNEVVAIMGNDDSGIKAVIPLMMGMYVPQGGSVRIDGLNIRRFDPLELRRTIGYMPEENNLFFGTIKENLRLVHPTASQEELDDVCEKVGLTETLRHLPKGMDTLVVDNWVRTIPTGFLLRLSIARVMLKKPKIILMQQPLTGLDDAGDTLLREAIEIFRQYATVVIVTHRPSIKRIADVEMEFHEGRLIQMKRKRKKDNLAKVYKPVFENKDMLRKALRSGGEKES